jgi:hypothetical protein
MSLERHRKLYTSLISKVTLGALSEVFGAMKKVTEMREQCLNLSMLHTTNFFCTLELDIQLMEVGPLYSYTNLTLPPHCYVAIYCTKQKHWLHTSEDMDYSVFRICLLLILIMLSCALTTL